MDEAPAWIPGTMKTHLEWCYRPVVPTFIRYRRGVKNSRSFLSYIISFRPTYKTLKLKYDLEKKKNTKAFNQCVL